MNETGSDAGVDSAVSALSPQLLARAYDRFVSARWRGEDEAADTVATWFEAHWVTQPAPEPDAPPAGASVLGGSGRGIRWYARDDEVFGYVPGHKEGCYRVATAEAVPTITAPWDEAPAAQATTGSPVRFAAQGEDWPLQETPAAELLAADRVLNHVPARNGSRSARAT